MTLKKMSNKKAGSEIFRLACFRGSFESIRKHKVCGRSESWKQTR